MTFIPQRYEALYPEEVAAGVPEAEIAHCEKVATKLADENGLVVVTPAVVSLLIQQRAAARVQEGLRRKWERAAVLRAIDKELSDWPSSSDADEALNALRKTIENGDHVK